MLCLELFIVAQKPGFPAVMVCRRPKALWTQRRPSVANPQVWRSAATQIRLRMAATLLPAISSRGAARRHGLVRGSGSEPVTRMAGPTADIGVSAKKILALFMPRSCAVQHAAFRCKRQYGQLHAVNSEDLSDIGPMLRGARQPATRPACSPLDHAPTRLFTYQQVDDPQRGACRCATDQQQDQQPLVDLFPTENSRLLALRGAAHLVAIDNVQPTNSPF